MDEDFQYIDAKRIKYPILATLYKFRKTESKNRDALCLACGKINLKYTLARIVKHAMNCNIDSRHRSILKSQSEEGEEKLSDSELDSRQNTNQIAADECLVVFIASNCLPISLVESKSF